MTIVITPPLKLICTVRHTKGTNLTFTYCFGLCLIDNFSDDDKSRNKLMDRLPQCQKCMSSHLLSSGIHGKHLPASFHKWMVVTAVWRFAWTGFSRDWGKFPALITVSVGPCCRPSDLQHHSLPNQHLTVLSTLPQWVCQLTLGLLLDASWPCCSCIISESVLAIVGLICFAGVLARWVKAFHVLWNCVPKAV